MIGTSSIAVSRMYIDLVTMSGAHVFRSAYYETLRLVPPVTSIPKRSAEDTTITVRDFQGNKVAVTVPKGTHISLDVAGLHYNRQSFHHGIGGCF